MKIFHGAPNQSKKYIGSPVESPFNQRMIMLILYDNVAYRLMLKL